LGQTVRNSRRFGPNRLELVLDGFGKNRPEFLSLYFNFF
jgi:hypothetical protein